VEVAAVVEASAEGTMEGAFAAWRITVLRRGAGGRGRQAALVGHEIDAGVTVVVGRDGDWAVTTFNVRSALAGN
jgi:hypothetical protein